MKEALRSSGGDKEAERRNAFPCMSVHDPDPNRSSMQLVVAQQMTLKVLKCKSRWQKQSAKRLACRWPVQTSGTWWQATAQCCLRAPCMLEDLGFTESSAQALGADISSSGALSRETLNLKV